MSDIEAAKDLLTPAERERVEWRRAEYAGARISSDVIGLLLIIDRLAPAPVDTEGGKP